MPQPSGGRTLPDAAPEVLLARARDVLLLRDAEGTSDFWLFEHAERIWGICKAIASLPELVERRVHQAALMAAALFHDAGWAVQINQGALPLKQLHNRPTSDVQRELAASLVREQLTPPLTSEAATLAADVIRQYTDRKNNLLEAQILCEARALDELGVMYVLRQFKQLRADGQSVSTLLKHWTARQTYRFWDARISDGFRFTATREIARNRLRSTELFMDAFAEQVAAADVTFRRAP